MALTLLQEASDFLAKKKSNDDERSSTTVELLESINLRLNHNFLALNSIDRTLRALLKINIDRVKSDLLGRGDKAEDRLEKKKKEKVPLSKGESMGRGFGEGVSTLLSFLKNPKSLLLGLTLGLAALTTGIRGLEVKVLGKLSKSLVSFVKSLKPVTEGKYAKQLGDISKTIGNWFKSIGTTIKSLFTNLSNRMSKSLRVAQKVISPVVKTVGAIFSFMGGFLKGLISPLTNIFSSGKKAGGITKMFSKVGAFFKNLPKLFGKIFLPIGILISTIEGAIAAFKSEGSFLDKMQVFFSTAIGDFIGAPLDLLKNIISWMATKLGFESFANFLDSFSIETIIKDSLQGVFDWVQLLFNDPLAAIKQYWDAVIGAYATIGGWIFDYAIKPVFDWITGLFGIKIESLDDLWKTLLGGLGSLIDIIYAPVNLAVNWIKGVFGWGDPDEPFKLSTFIFSIFGSVKEWFTKLFEWGKEAGTEEDGEWSLSKLFSSTVDSIMTWFGELFDFLPSLDEIKSMLYNLMPDWMKTDEQKDADRIREQEARHAKARSNFSSEIAAKAESENWIRDGKYWITPNGSVFSEDVGYIERQRPHLVERYLELQSQKSVGEIEIPRPTSPNVNAQTLSMMGDGSSSMKPLIVNNISTDNSTSSSQSRTFHSSPSARKSHGGNSLHQ